MVFVFFFVFLLFLYLSYVPPVLSIFAFFSWTFPAMRSSLPGLRLQLLARVKIRQLCVMNVHDDRKIELYNRLCYMDIYRYMTWHQDWSKSQFTQIATYAVHVWLDILTWQGSKQYDLKILFRYCESCELNGKRHPWVNLLDLALSLASSSLETSGRRFFLTGSATWASAGPSTASDSASLAARAAALSRTAWTEADTMPPMVSLGKRSQKNASIWMHFEWSVLNSMYQWLGLILECLGFAYGVQSRCHT